MFSHENSVQRVENSGRWPIPILGISSILGEITHFKGSKMANNEKTSKGVASKASEQLKDKKSTPDQKSVAGSALTQTADKKKK